MFCTGRVILRDFRTTVVFWLFDHFGRKDISVFVGRSIGWFFCFLSYDRAMVAQIDSYYLEEDNGRFGVVVQGVGLSGKSVYFLSRQVKAQDLDKNMSKKEKILKKCGFF